MTEELIRHRDAFYILSTSARIDDRTRVLKDADTFAVFDRYGDFHPFGLGEQGLYHDGTRHLSRLDVRLHGHRPLLLSSSVREDNARLTADLANADPPHGKIGPPAYALHVLRSIFLWGGTCHQRFELRSFAAEPLAVALDVDVEADFADLFEVRGTSRAARGRVLAPIATDGALVLRYLGLDGVERRTRISGTPPPRIEGSAIHFEATLAPGEERAFEIAIACESSGAPARAGATHDAAFAAASRARASARSRDCRVDTSNEQFNDWLNRSYADFAMMLTWTEDGPYPYAGVPWYSTPFGRDGILTALEWLWVNPSIARGVLLHLARLQATSVDPSRDAEPGKILHEMRRGEMAALGEVPFGLYYGSVDSTPLFAMLAGAYVARTADRAFAEAIWPSVERALRWIEEFGDVDGDGFVEYRRRAANGLANQGWKDSQDSVFHADGTLVEGAIALCEVQGYAYEAMRSGAAIARALGLAERAGELERAAAELRDRFEAAFWMDDLGTYALALDPAKRPCRVRTSNAGHVLFSGIADAERARRTAETLLDEASFSGWGIRTVAATEARYNPMSYHNGSVWPHDNALVARGFARYGRNEDVLRVLSGLFDASLFVELHRLPEVLCGFARRAGEGPTNYPVACAPQAWAIGTPFLLLQSCLGLEIDARHRTVILRNGVLPPFLDEVRIRDLEITDGATVDLTLRRRREGISIEAPRRSPGVEIVGYH